MNTEWLALITVSLPLPSLAAFIRISQEEKPPAHVITPSMPRCPTEEWQMAPDRNCAATLHCPCCLGVPKSRFSSPVPSSGNPTAWTQQGSPPGMLGTLGAGNRPGVPPWGISPVPGVLWQFLSCLHQNMVDFAAS